MKRTQPRHRYSIGELVIAAYQQAGHLTHDHAAAAVVATKLLETWLARSSRPDLVDRLFVERT